MSFAFNSSVNNLSGRMPIFKFDHMNQNQGRTFGPLLGLFLVNLLAKAVTAKYDSYFPFHLSLDPSPWLPYNKPLPNYNYHTVYSQWYPIKNPYSHEAPSYQTYPILTTAAPYLTGEHLPVDYASDYREDYDYPVNTHDSNDFDRLIPSGSKYIQKKSIQEFAQITTPYPPNESNSVPKKPTEEFLQRTTSYPPTESIQEFVEPTTSYPPTESIQEFVEPTTSYPTTESNYIHKKSIQDFIESTTQEFIKGTTFYPEEEITVTSTVTPTVTSTVPPFTTIPVTVVTSIEPVAAASNSKVKRQKYRKRVPSRRDKYPQRRRRPTTTTPPPDYYDSYEDYTERYQPNRKRRPPYNRQSVESYYDDNNSDEYYDSFETTTRYYKKPKRRPTRKANKNHESSEIETSTERINPNTEIVIVRQAQPTSTTTTTQTSSIGTTTEPTTIITNSTASTTTTASSNGTYGYGPSNGNEQVSFTYGPPVGKYQYQVPYFDWYTHEATKNAIVKRVRDIVNVDKRLNFK